ncbi:hypothetical protein NL529_34165, partial [Klebsiella pneumoniae]|nr:hypothetical protein [Klebsiella pneumoniae]
EGTLTVLDKQGTLTVHPCGLNQPTCTWSAIGSYKKVTANGWIVNPKEAPFTVGAMDPVDVAKLTQGAGTPQENITRV